MLCHPEEKNVGETDDEIHKNEANGSKACQLRPRVLTKLRS
jgi:hypothetical protein